MPKKQLSEDLAMKYLQDKIKSMFQNFCWICLVYELGVLEL
uniref:Uncharacterized protein n=1 Tax=Setaria italica TaxID=4555 RepID=K3XUN0_SETIT